MCIAGFQTPDQGLIACGDDTFADRGARVDLAAEQRNLGIVFQSYAIWPHMTVTQNVAFPLRVRKMSKPAIRGRVADVLALVELGELATATRKCKPARNSGRPGPRQSVLKKRCRCSTSRSQIGRTREQARGSKALQRPGAHHGLRDTHDKTGVVMSDGSGRRRAHPARRTPEVYRQPACGLSPSSSDSAADRRHRHRTGQRGGAEDDQGSAMALRSGRHGGRTIAVRGDIESVPGSSSARPEREPASSCASYLGDPCPPGRGRHALHARQCVRWLPGQCGCASSPASPRSSSESRPELDQPG
jgi:hypothetical protein